MKITKNQLKQIIQEELQNMLGEQAVERGEMLEGVGDPARRDPNYEELLEGCKELLNAWLPKTREGKQYKEQLADLVVNVERGEILEGVGDPVERDPNYERLLEGCENLLDAWKPVRTEGKQYKEQLDNLVTDVKFNELLHEP